MGMKTAIVTGVCGQDGAYLSQLLLEKGYNVVGWARRNASLRGLEYLGIKDKIKIVDIDICDAHHVADEIYKTQPQEIYNLAAQSHVGLSFKNPMQTCSVNYGGYLNVLLAARKFVPTCKIYQAGTSEMFGYSAEGTCNEQTPFAPMSPYAISKVASHWAGVNARYEADQFVCNGILFNHESPLRGDDFVTKKITNFVKNFTGVECLQLGNLDSSRDWGHAKDYVEAMYLMMQHRYPDDYVVATGQSITVRHFVRLAFQHIGKDVEFEGEGMTEKGYINGVKVIEVSPEFYRPNDLKYLKGSANKAKHLLGWKPATSIESLAEEMVEA
jgi:GDPmannose 4,6-dehydratase